MPPTVILIRHVQDYSLHDPSLTEEGLSQCDKLKESLQRTLDGETDIAIVVSPMRRTIQTALSSLDWLIQTGVPITAHASWQENGDQPCDTGSNIAALAAEFPLVDFSHVDPVFPDKTSPAGRKYAYTRAAVLARGRACLENLYSRHEKWVIVVSHSGFLRLGMVGRWFFNGDYRIFDFDEVTPQGGLPQLQQWESTLSGGLGWSWTHPVELGSGIPDVQQSQEPQEPQELPGAPSSNPNPIPQRQGVA